MPKYIVNVRTPLLPAANAAATEATPRLDPFTRFAGGVPGMHVAKTDDPKGFVDSADVEIVPDTLATPATDADRTAFCETVTRLSLTANANRDYLLAVAYWKSRKLSDFGKPDDAKVGPFALTVQDWQQAAGPASTAEAPLLPIDMFDPTAQARAMAVRSAKAMKDFGAGPGGLKPVDLYFFERLGADARKLLDLDKTKPCSDAFAAPPAAGSYAAEIANKVSGDVIKEATDGLMMGFGASRSDVGRLPVLLRYFTDEDWAPWLAVARMMQGDSLQTSTDKRIALFMSTLIDGTPPPATFVAFCMIFCGDPVVKAKLPPNNLQKPETWETWGDKAPDPAPAGAVVITDGTVAQGIGILAGTATSDPVNVWMCSKDAAGVVKVELKPVAKGAITKMRWLDLSTATTAGGGASTRAPGANDSLFAAKAPGIMTKLITDFALSDVQAAAILGNIGHECMGFQAMQELKPTGQDGRGGLGWCQWTDERRTAFEKFAAEHNLSVQSDDANYGFLKQELSSARFKSMLATLSNTDLEAAVETFEEKFEVAALATVNFPSRRRYAEIALGLHRQKLDPKIA
jgi:hypothetical protein